jgi:hypothetical protein
MEVPPRVPSISRFLAETKVEFIAGEVTALDEARIMVSRQPPRGRKRGPAGIVLIAPA